MILYFYKLHCLSLSLFNTFLLFQKESMRQQANADPSSVKKCSAMWRESHWEKPGLSWRLLLKHRGLKKHKYNLSDVTEKKTSPVHNKSIYSQQTRLWIETTRFCGTINTEKNASRYCSFSLWKNSQNVNVLVKLEDFFMNFGFILHVFLSFIYL